MIWARTHPGAVVRWTLLLIGGLIMMMPIIFMISTSLKTGVGHLRPPDHPARADTAELCRRPC